jgi:hypothetical protein
MTFSRNPVLGIRLLVAATAAFAAETRLPAHLLPSVPVVSGIFPFVRAHTLIRLINLRSRIGVFSGTARVQPVATGRPIIAAAGPFAFSQERRTA